MYHKRIKMLSVIFIALLSLLVFRLGYIQLIEGSKYSGISDKRRIKRKPLEALRGKIFDRNNIVLATNRHSFNISVKYNDLLYYYLKHKDQLLPRLGRIKEHKKDTESCVECHNDQENLFGELLNVVDDDQNMLFEIAKKTVKRVEMIKKEVSKRKGREVRIVEEIGLHPVAQDVSFEKIAKIESKQSKFPGIFVEIKACRWYPNHKLASHIMGYIDEVKDDEWKSYKFKWNCFDNWPFVLNSVAQKSDNKLTVSFCDEIIDKRLNIDRLFSLGYRGDVSVGRTGIEAYYNMVLLGKPGERFEEITYENFKPDKIIIERQANSGENIFLTINCNIQFLAEKALGNRRGAVIVMNPWNGEVIAMASNPRFDPNTFNEDFNNIIKDQRKPLLNRPIQSTLPPGSTFKIVTAVAALAEKAISDEILFECYGRERSNQNRFRCSSKYGHGMLNVEEALQHSCNAFFFKAANQLGGNNLYKWGKKFGFGKPCGIDIPYERKGLLPKPTSSWEIMNTSIGQGDLLATPLQITKMIAMIANGGRDIKPHILKNITEYSGKIVMKTDIETNNAQIPKSVIEIVKQGLIKVVTNGTARKIGIDKYLVAGKTGTAETKNEKDNHAWFTGFAPYDNPKYCFTVLIEHTPMHSAEATTPVLQPLLAGLFPEINSTY